MSTHLVGVGGDAYVTLHKLLPAPPSLFRHLLPSSAFLAFHTFVTCVLHEPDAGGIQLESALLTASGPRTEFLLLLSSINFE